MMRKFGQEIIKATAGKKIHGTGAIPGGVNKNLTIEERDEFLPQGPRPDDGLVQKGHVKDRRRITPSRTWRSSLPFGSFDSNHLSIVREDGAMDLYHGNLRAIDATKARRSSTRSITRRTTTRCIAEEVRPWSYMKFPFIKSLGPEDGWYRVGPLARSTRATSSTRRKPKRPQGVHGGHGRQAEQRDHGLPLGADDRTAALGREDQGTAERPGSAGRRPGGEG
jgi:NAD-reducing hydrogenase large subunit